MGLLKSSIVLLLFLLILCDMQSSEKESERRIKELEGTTTARLQ
jgi:hypothetical protein